MNKSANVKQVITSLLPFEVHQEMMLRGHHPFEHDGTGMTPGALFVTVLCDTSPTSPLDY